MAGGLGAGVGAQVGQAAGTPGFAGSRPIGQAVLGATQRGSGIDAARRASQHWGVPAWLLLGIYGMETDFGANVHTSSTGADGPMQFEPGTWKTYGHGRNVQDVYAAMDAAAEKLRHDAGPRKDWAAAVTAYGGGYSLADVKKKYRSLHNPLRGVPVLGSAAGAVQQAAGTASDIAGALSDFFNTITDPRTWLHVAEVIGGAVLIVMALHQLAGTPSVGDVARHLPVPVPV